MPGDADEEPIYSGDRSKSTRTLPLTNTIQKVKGYNTLTLYMMEASPFWYVRYYEDGKIYRRSTKTTDKRDAVKFAQDFFAEIKLKKMNKLPFTRKSGFEVCARGLLKENEGRLLRGEISESKQRFDETRLEKDLLPYFERYEVADIDYKAISGYIASISTAERKLSTNSLKVHLSHIKTILKYAQRMGVIIALPAFPKLATIDKPRGWFNSFEYSKLHNTARANIGKSFRVTDGDGNNPRNVELTAELHDLILFMTNTLIRPTDIRVLRHKHITIVRSPHLYLRLTHPPTKKHANPVVSMPAAVKVYERLLQRQLEQGYGKSDDYVFQPQHANRDYAMHQLHRQFDRLLQLTDLKTDPMGEARSLYSLRHTAIMFRLLHAENLDLMTLARNARTSVEMIDRFYASHLTPEMKVAELQSLKKHEKPEISGGSRGREPAQGPSPEHPQKGGRKRRAAVVQGAS